jgi:phosphoglycolate phosphatase
VGDVRRLIVFDLDGTLIDSRADLADAANALIVERGGDPLPEEAVGRMVGEGAALLVHRAFAAAALSIDERSVARFLELYDERLLRKTRPYPGIHAVLEALASRNVVAVLTNKPLAPARRLLDALELSMFVASVIGGDGPDARKPDPAGLFRLIEGHRSSPAQAVLVGDSRIDFETARAAQTAFCLARYGFGCEGFPTAQLRSGEGIVDAPGQIPGVIERLLDFREGPA